MPMLRAVPATCSFACSRSSVLRSGSLIWAISVTWASVIDAAAVAARRARCLLDAGGLANQERGRRRLQREAEGPVLEDGDLDRHDLAALVLGAGVVLLAEVHDRHAVGAQRGTDRRRRRCLTGRDLDLDHCGRLASSFALGCVDGSNRPSRLPSRRRVRWLAPDQWPVVRPVSSAHGDGRRRCAADVYGPAVDGTSGRERLASADARACRPGRTRARPGSRDRRC